MALVASALGSSTALYAGLAGLVVAVLGGGAWFSYRAGGNASSVAAAKQTAAQEAESLREQQAMGQALAAGPHDEAELDGRLKDHSA